MSFNTKKITWGIAGLLALASVAFLFTTAIVPYGASADSTQAREDLLPADGGVFNPFIETHIDIVQGGTRARVSVSNTSASNEYTISMASYELHTAYGSPDFISSQTLFDSRTRTIGPGETITFGPSLPSCNYQVDLFEGPSVPQTNPDFGAEPLISTHTLFDWIIALDQGTCGGDDPELSVEKTGPNTISPGEVVSYDIRVTIVLLTMLMHR